MAVVPLRRWGLVFSAMVVGSMAPDFEYFFGLKRGASHALPGIVTFTFPLAVAVLVLFHKLLKWPLISLLPRGLQARVIGPSRRFRWFPATRFFMILLSIAVGIATHIFLDGFTHGDGWAARHSAALQQPVSFFGHFGMPLYDLLQLGCTAAGMVVLAICFVAWYKRTTAEQVRLRPQFSPGMKWTIVGAMMATALVLGLVNGGNWYEPLLQGEAPHARYVIGFAITSVTVGIVELFGFSLILRAYRSVQRARVPASADK